MKKADHRIRVVLYSQQPFVVQGVTGVFKSQKDLNLAACCESLTGALDALKSIRPHVLVVHPLSGCSLSDLRELRAVDNRCQVVLWGQELGGEFAFQAMQLGVASILPGSTSIEDFLAAVRNVHKGVLCFERDLLESVLSQNRVALTARQAEIVSLVAQGLKNKEIAFQMGITEGTVKVYLYKLFKKLGMNDRLDMALYGRRNLFSGQHELERVRDTGPAGRQFAGKAADNRSVLSIARKPSGVPVIH
ncbi:MAG TPA: response regulator transcription factor [Candidatus Sulfopaludibacter sp.]|nr:response regulator transcription factor [Candidatus Sulfopaludibacter sp.]